MLSDFRIDMAVFLSVFLFGTHFAYALSNKIKNITNK